MKEDEGEWEAVGVYLIIEDKIEEQKMGGTLMSGSDTGHLRAKKAEIISPGEVDSMKEGNMILYDAARTFKVMVEGKPLTIIRIHEVIAVKGKND